MIDSLIVIGIVVIAFIIVLALVLNVFGINKCNHQWRVVHDTKYDNIGFRNKYAIVVVCDKCGKIKKVK